MMAQKNPIEAVEVDGISVKVDTGYTKSWDGIRKAARMESTERTIEERGIAMVEYYEHAISNLDEVSEKLAGESADKVLGILSKAIMEATPKN